MGGLLVRLHPFPRPQRTKYSSAQLPCTLRPSRQCSPSQVTKGKTWQRDTKAINQKLTNTNKISNPFNTSNMVQSLLHNFTIENWKEKEKKVESSDYLLGV